MPQAVLMSSVPILSLKKQLLNDTQVLWTAKFTRKKLFTTTPFFHVSFRYAYNVTTMFPKFSNANFNIVSTVLLLP